MLLSTTLEWIWLKKWRDSGTLRAAAELVVVTSVEPAEGKFAVELDFFLAWIEMFYSVNSV